MCAALACLIGVNYVLGILYSLGSSLMQCFVHWMFYIINWWTVCCSSSYFFFLNKYALIRLKCMREVHLVAGVGVTAEVEVLDRVEGKVPGPAILSFAPYKIYLFWILWMLFHLFLAVNQWIGLLLQGLDLHLLLDQGIFYYYNWWHAYIRTQPFTMYIRIHICMCIHWRNLVHYI